MKVVLLSGGSGGAKLATGLYDMLAADLTVIANTGDDLEVNGVHVSPDADLITYWLSGEIDAERGWGIRDDTFTVCDRLELLGAPGWFRLTDRDLATCLYRRQFMEEGGRQTVAQRQIVGSLGVEADVLPMCDEPVRTRVSSLGEWRELQEYLILAQGEPPVDEVRLEGIEHAEPTEEALAAISAAELILIGPSNPVISIGPILSLPGLREALVAAEAPVVAVSPFVGGRVVKGPTEAFMAALGLSPDALSVASLYQGVIDGMLLDEGDREAPEGIETASAPTAMTDRDSRVRVARKALELGARMVDR